jgi:ABC-type multidrug transport system ATPase subunit
MQIELTNLGKRFNRQWIFRKLDYTFKTGNTYAITGYNGSGKSTLLQIMAGALEKSEGELTYKNDAGILPTEQVYKFISFSAPYLELIEELTLTEFFNFHFSLKPLLDGFSIKDVMEKIELLDAQHKQIRQFSSGMKQRAKLGQAFFSRVPILFLDEPTANLDAKGILLYHKLIQDYTNDRLVVICSNDEQEISFCSYRIDVTSYKRNDN